MANIIGTNGNDTLQGTSDNDPLIGGGGNDKFVYNSLGYYGTNAIADFGGVGKGTNPTAEVIAEVDTLVFTGTEFTAQNLLLTQNGTNLEISFQGLGSRKLVLQNFALENLDNLSKSTGAAVDLGNIVFDGQTSSTDSFDVFNANSTQSTIFNKNTVTFLNDLNNNVSGFDNSDDVINGQGGDDIINGLSGNDLLRGGAGNDLLRDGAGNNTLNGGAGDDTLNASGSTGDNLLDGGDGNDFLDISGIYFNPVNYDSRSLGNNTLNGGAGDDTLNASGSRGDNLLSGGDGNDSLDISGNFDTNGGQENATDSRSLGDNTLKGGAGDDTLDASGSIGDNLLDGGDGNDSLKLTTSGSGGYVYSGSEGNNTLNGGAGDDYLDISGYLDNLPGAYTDSRSSGDNLLDGGDGNDTLRAFSTLGDNTLNGGAGDDILIAADSKGNNLLFGGDGDDSLSSGIRDNDTLKGGNGKDKFFYNQLFSNYGINTIATIADFGGVGKGKNPTAAVIAQVDTLVFTGDSLTAQNLLLNQNGNNLEITFEGFGNGKLILENFALENLDNLSKSTGATVDLGNILFNGQTSTTDSFDVFDAKSTQSTVFRKNTVTFLNDLSNNVSGFDNSDDVINGQGGDDIINGLSGNDILRGGVGNNTLNGGVGADTLNVDFLSSNNLLNGGDGNDSLTASGYKYDYRSYLDGESGYDLRPLGNNTLNGGGGADTLDASGSLSDNVLYGGDGNDSLSISGYSQFDEDFFGGYSTFNSRSDGDNTLNGGAGDDTLSVSGSSGDNLLFGGDGNDFLSISGYSSDPGDPYYFYDSRSNGYNTLSGGAGNDTLIGASGIVTFVFNSFNEGLDTIDDFNLGQVIRVSAVGFGGGLSTGVLSASEFTIGTSATTSTQRFIYNSTTGALFFDQDGSAAGFTQVQFALVTAGLSLTNNNFAVV
ncbi:calcium-binding protein [Nostoc sp. FACHB-973]|nr:calcium-binding protein [Nostoc sp. FACHB-973]